MPSALSQNSSTAAVAFGSVHLRVYFQDNEGYVRESQWDGSWTGGSEKNRLFRAKQNTPLAAITWGSTPHIRVYYVDNNNILQEHCWDGQWANGSLGSKNIKVDYRSKIAACSWSATPQIRIYYQAPYDENIREGGWDGKKWEAETTLVKAPLGTGLAVIAFGNVHLRVYYQDQIRKVREHAWDGKWASGATLGEATAGTAITATTWASGPEIRVYCEFSSGNGTGICEMGYGAGRGWSGPGQPLTTPLTGTSMSICSWGNIQIRFYYQKEASQVQEYAWSGKWAQGAVIPTE